MTEGYLTCQLSTLGAVLIDPNAAGTVIHRTREEDYTGPYRSIYKAIKSVFLSGRPADITLVAAQLGPEYQKLLLEMVELTPTAVNVDVHIDGVLEEALKTRVRECAEALQTAVTMDEIRALWEKMNRSMAARPGVRVVSMDQGLQDFYERQKAVPETLPWGMRGLDDTVLTERGDFTVIGGYASAGKTAFSLQLAWNQAERLRVGYFSLETKPEKLIDRTVALVTGLDFGKIKRHQLGQDDWTVCGKHAPAMAQRTLEIIQSGGLTAADIQALSLAGRYDVIYVDYLQLIRAEDTRRTDTERVTQISQDLHTMAQTTGITVVALSQLSRPEKSGDQEKTPNLHSLRQSGQIEQDADAVLLLYKKNPKDPLSQRELKVAKNKEGEAGGVLLLDFDGRTQRFTPAEHTKDVAQACAQTGRAAKAANRIRQTSLFREISTPDANLPF